MSRYSIHNYDTRLKFHICEIIFLVKKKKKKEKKIRGRKIRNNKLISNIKKEKKRITLIDEKENIICHRNYTIPIFPPKRK